MTDDQIRAYFTGPAHLAWHRMSNIDHFDGPLPQNWIDSQVKLQKKILKRERQLNMKPVLSAFSGHVPEQLKERYPDAVITDIPRWSGFPAENLCHFLSPTDPLFARIQKEFMVEQEKMSENVTRLFEKVRLFQLTLKLLDQLKSVKILKLVRLLLLFQMFQQMLQ